MSAMYAVYHGPDGIKTIAKRIALLTQTLAEALEQRGVEVLNKNFFDTITIKVTNASAIKEKANAAGTLFILLTADGMKTLTWSPSIFQ